MRILLRDVQPCVALPVAGDGRTFLCREVSRLTIRGTPPRSRLRPLTPVNAKFFAATTGRGILVWAGRRNSRLAALPTIPRERLLSTLAESRSTVYVILARSPTMPTANSRIMGIGQKEHLEQLRRRAGFPWLVVSRAASLMQDHLARAGRLADIRSWLPLAKRLHASGVHHREPAVWVAPR